MRAARLFVGALFTFGTVAACSGGGSTGSTAASSDSFISQYCDLYVPCCERAGLPKDGRQCRSLYTAVGGSAEYDAAQGEACLNGIRAAPTDLCGSDSSSPPACSKVFKTKAGGAKQPGEECTQDADCAASAEGEVECQTQFTASATVKKCQVQIKGKEGDKTCIGTVTGSSTSFSSGSSDSEFISKGYLCDTKEGLFCDSTTKACGKLVALDGDCKGGKQCVNDARCNFATNKCEALGKDGADCQGSGTCAKGLECDAATKKCKALKKEGEACKANTECATGTCTNGLCKISGVFALICGK